MARPRVAAPETRPILVLNTSARMSYQTLRHWLDGHAGMSPIAVMGGGSAALSMAVAPRAVHTVPDEPRLPRLLSFVAGRGLSSTISRNAVVVLCVSDEQVTSGRAPYRIVGELLWSDRLILIGPRCVQTWPGGRGLLRPARAREVATLVAAGALSILTTMTALSAVAVQETLLRLKARQ